MRKKSFKVPNTVRFRCLSCGECCKTNGRVYLYLRDISGISKRLNLSINSFINDYCEFRIEKFIFTDKVVEYEVLSLLKNSHSCCIFIENNLCSIHSFKPLQCKIAPFIDPIITNDESWHSFIKKCKGFKNGKIYHIDSIKSFLSAHKAERALYFQALSNNNFSLEETLGISIKNNPIKINISLTSSYEDFRCSNNKILKKLFLERR